MGMGSVVEEAVAVEVGDAEEVEEVVEMLLGPLVTRQHRSQDRERRRTRVNSIVTSGLRRWQEADSRVEKVVGHVYGWQLVRG